MATIKENPADQATHDSGNRNADHGTGSDQHQLHRGIKKIPIELNSGKPPAQNQVQSRSTKAAGN